MLHSFSRTELLIGAPALQVLANSKIAVFGIGGVGSFVVEGLVRSGVGSFALIDDDCVCLTNLNRQLQATTQTVGQPKVAAMKQRILAINPRAQVIIHQEFYLPDNAETMLADDYDYIVDAMDTVTAKIDLIVRAGQRHIPVISCMGAGNKLDPTRFEVTDIYKTSVCPLAKVMRKELRARGVEALKVVYSKESPVAVRDSEGGSCATGCICPPGTTRKCTDRRQIPGSMAFVPSVAGLIIAGEVVKELIGAVGEREG